MKTSLLVIAGLSLSLASAGAASAQPWRGGGSSPRADALHARIDNAARRGALSPYDRRDLHSRVDQIARLEWRYGRNGLSGRERQELNRRYADVMQQFRYEARNGGRRDYGYGYGYR